MGYDVHITRRKDWSDAGDDITTDEWLAVVGADTELTIDPEQGPYFAIWKSAEDNSGEWLWLDWDDGQVYAKNPEPDMITKMIAIAKLLDATVLGDDGEGYEEGFFVDQTAGATRSIDPPASNSPKPSLWRRFQLAIQGKPKPAPIVTRATSAPFKVGDRVRDNFGFMCTVVAVDPAGMHGHGQMDIRRDTGFESSSGFIGHGLTLVDDE